MRTLSCGAAVSQCVFDRRCAAASRPCRCHRAPVPGLQIEVEFEGRKQMWRSGRPLGGALVGCAAVRLSLAMEPPTHCSTGHSSGGLLLPAACCLPGCLQA